MDLITDLPLADGFDSILVVVDQGLSKGVILIPCNKTITSEDTPLAIPLSFKNTKYPSIEERMGTLLWTTGGTRIGKESYDRAAEINICSV